MNLNSRHADCHAWRPFARHLLVLLIVLAMGATSAMAGKFATKQEEERRGEADSQHALVYLVRTGFAGSAIYFWTFVDEEFFGILRGRSYTYGLIPAGDHLLWCKAENIAALSLHLEAGKTYYLREKVMMGIGKARVKLELIDEAEGLKALTKARKYSTPTEEGRSRALWMAEKYIARARKKVKDAVKE